MISIHQDFPAALLRLQQQRKSALIDKTNRDDSSSNPDGAVLVSNDGLVYPRAENKPPCRAAPLWKDYNCADVKA